MDFNVEARPLVIKNQVYEDFLVLEDSRIWCKKNNKGFIEGYTSIGYLNRQDTRYCIDQNHLNLSSILAYTFPDKIGKSPLVDFFRLKIGDNPYNIITPTGYQWIGAKTVTIDHINRNPLDNSLGNLRFAASLEQGLNTRAKIGLENHTSQYKGVSLTPFHKWQTRLELKNLINKLGQYIRKGKNYDSELDAALAYNFFNREALIEAFGANLGIQVYEEVAFKNQPDYREEYLFDICNL